MDVFRLEENRSRHLPLVEEGEWGLPVASVFGGSTPLGFAGDAGGGDVAYSSSKQEKSSCSSSRSSLLEWSTSRDPYKDPFVPTPLDELTTGRGDKSALVEVEPSSLSKTDLIPRTVVGGGAGTCER